MERFTDLTIRVIQIFGTDAKVTLVHRLLMLRVGWSVSRLFWVGKVVLSAGAAPVLIKFWFIVILLRRMGARVEQ